MVNKKILSYGLFLLLFGHCDKANQDPGPPYKAKVVNLKRVSANSGPAEFALETKELKTLTSLNDLKGSYLEFKSGGTLYIKSLSDGSLQQADKFEDGENPSLRYHIKDSVVVPNDYNTLALLSAYYQYEQVILNLKDRTGIDLSEIMATVPSGRYQVLFEPLIQLEVEDGSSAQVTMKLNAAYVPGQKQFLLNRRSRAELLPLAANLQVIAHEFGHALFEHVFFRNVFEQEGKLESSYAMNGLNEGFADLMSYHNTGSADILGSSIDIERAVKERQFKTTTFTFSQLTGSNKSESVCKSSYYCIGIIFARSITQAEDLLVSSLGITKDQFFAGFIQALKNTKANMNLNALSSKVEGNVFSQTIDGAYLGSFFGALVGQLPAAWKQTVCNQLKSENNFGTAGFAIKYRPTECGG